MRAGGRAREQRARPPSPSLRLKRSIDVFPASDGALYLLRLGAGDDVVLERPTPGQRALIDLLAGGYRTRGELRAQLADRGHHTGELAAELADLEDADLLEQAPAAAQLTAAQAERYDRQLIYFADLAGPNGSAPELQARLLAARVLILGCGALGSWTASALSGAGVGSLVLVDDDRVELSNLNRQLLFTEAQVGTPKVAAAAESLRRHRSDLHVEEVRRRVGSPGQLADLLGGVDMVIATADWPPHELPRWVNRACVDAGVAFMNAGQFPPRARIGPLVVPGRTPCVECLEAHARRDYPLYDELSAYRARGSTPDAALAPTSAAIGAMLASEAMHFLIGGEPSLLGHAALLDLRELSLRLEAVDRHPDCPACGGAEPRS